MSKLTKREYLLQVDAIAVETAIELEMSTFDAISFGRRFLSKLRSTESTSDEMYEILKNLGEDG